MQAEENIRLLTPNQLQAMLLQIFEDYRNSRKPSFLIDNPIAPAALNSDDELGENAQDAPKSTAGMLGSIGSFFKSAAALAIEHGTRKHSTLTKFITEEMAHILNQPGTSQLKIMTDLTILLNGLHHYMLTTNSVTLSPQLDSVNKQIWPYKGIHDSILVFEEVKQKNMFESRDSRVRVSIDHSTFLTKFKVQIERAQDLVSHNTTLKDKNQTAELRNPVNPLLAVDKPEWQYRCNEVGSNDVGEAPEAWMGDAYGAFLSNEAPRAAVAGAAPNSKKTGVN